MDHCKGKIEHLTRADAEASIVSLVAERMSGDNGDILAENLHVYPHEDHFHVGHSYKTPLQELLITVRRFQK